MSTDRTASPAIPLADWADCRLSELGRESGSAAISALSGATLLGERAMLNGFCVPGHISAGGGCRLLPTSEGGSLALSLPRPSDRELLPALFGDASIDVTNDDAIAEAVVRHGCHDLLMRGRTLGLAVASTDEQPSSSPIMEMSKGAPIERAVGHRPLVIDLSAIWAGPLAGHLLWLAGANVVKVESQSRPDAMRDGDGALYALLNQGKSSVSLNLMSAEGKTALISLIRRADIVIESSRPRALQQLGIDADMLVREVPGLVWLSLTAHGATGEAANWIGLGDDVGVAAGLTKARQHAYGSLGFVGDAIADPISGIATALVGWRAFQNGDAKRLGFSMSAIVASALKETRNMDPHAFDDMLCAWCQNEGKPFPQVSVRKTTDSVHDLGADNQRWLEHLPC